LTAIGPPALNAVLVTLILPNVFSLVAGLRGSVELFAAGGCDGVVVDFLVFDFVVVVEACEDFDLGGLAAVEVVAGVAGVVGVVAVVAAVVAAATLADLPPEPSPQPVIATTAQMHAATPASDTGCRPPLVPNRCCPPNLRPIAILLPETPSDIQKVGTIQV
jgi:hypothetical protein